MNAKSYSSDPHCGVVVKKSTNTYLVKTGDDLLACTLSSRMWKASRSDPVAVGDKVQLDGTQILGIFPRRNCFSRRAAVPMPSAHAAEQVIAANLDQVIPVFAANHPSQSWHLLDRLLVSAEASAIPALVCITKLDLLGPGPRTAEFHAALADYRRIGYSVLLTSAVRGDGLDKLRDALRGRLSVFVGQSGVGKSSLLNALEPGLGLRVQEMNRASHRGRHTTTHREIIPLGSGGEVIDTPGFREFGLWDVPRGDLALFFPEMRPLVGTCKFGLGCAHDEEPDCAIRRAVLAGEISPYRYQSYLRLKDER